MVKNEKDNFSCIFAALLFICFGEANKIDRKLVIWDLTIKQKRNGKN